jgi:hypothetical protein
LISKSVEKEIKWNGNGPNQNEINKKGVLKATKHDKYDNITGTGLILFMGSNYMHMTVHVA